MSVCESAPASNADFIGGEAEFHVRPIALVLQDAIQQLSEAMDSVRFDLRLRGRQQDDRFRRSLRIGGAGPGGLQERGSGRRPLPSPDRRASVRGRGRFPAEGGGGRPGPPPGRSAAAAGRFRALRWPGSCQATHQAATSTVGVRQRRKKAARQIRRRVLSCSCIIFQFLRRHFVEQFPSCLDLGQAIAAELIDHRRGDFKGDDVLQDAACRRHGETLLRS